MTALKDRILGIVKSAGKVSESYLLQLTTDDNDYILDDLIKSAISELVESGTIILGDVKVKKIYRMPDSFYRPEIKWGWESHLKLIDPWGGVEKKFSSGEWVYDTWRRGLGDKMRWVRKPIPEDKRDGMEIRRQWMYNAFWRYSLVSPDGTFYTIEEEINDCD